MENIVPNLCAKFNYDQMRNEKTFQGIEKSDNNNPKKNNKTTSVAIGDPFLGPITGDFSYAKY